MASTAKTPSPIPHRAADCCSERGCDSGLKNKYYMGKRLTPDSFRIEQEYGTTRRRLLNRAMHGWGVVYGFDIKVTPPGDACKPALTIQPGLALDKCGRELVQMTSLTIALEGLMKLGELVITAGERGGSARTAEVDTTRSATAPECWLLSAHYAEKDIDPVQATSTCNCDHLQWDHACETVRYSLRQVDCHKCCDDFKCELNCDCIAEAGHCDDADCVGRRGGCRCLCEHLARLTPAADCICLSEIEEPCGHAQVDIRHGVPLACITLRREEGGAVAIDNVDTCGPRRLVKHNDLLFDLIRGCDLTHIADIGWARWHRSDDPVPFSEFAEAFGEAPAGQVNCITNMFSIRFSRPVRKSTLRADCFVMTALIREHEGGWWETFRIPIVGLYSPGPDDDKLTREVRVVVPGKWIVEAIKGPYKRFHDPETVVEIEIHGDFIIDCNGQAVDANAVGVRAAPTGNGTPGGTFRSSFRVAQPPTDRNH